MLDAEVGTKAEVFALTICVIRYKSIFFIGFNVFDGFKVLNNGPTRFIHLNVLDGFESLTSFFRSKVIVSK